MSCVATPTHRAAGAGWMNTGIGLAKDLGRLRAESGLNRRTVPVPGSPRWPDSGRGVQRRRALPDQRRFTHGGDLRNGQGQLVDPVVGNSNQGRSSSTGQQSRKSADLASLHRPRSSRAARRSVTTSEAGQPFSGVASTTDPDSDPDPAVTSALPKLECLRPSHWPRWDCAASVRQHPTPTAP